MYAIIETGGKQYKVCPGDVIYTESLNVSEGSEVNFKVLAKSDDSSFTFGKDLSSSVANAKVVKNGKRKKIVVFKYKAKKNYKRKKGHRQNYSKVEILSIS